MTTIIKNTEIKITFTSGAWYVESLNGHCFKRFNTEKKAMKYFEKLSYQMGL